MVAAEIAHQRQEIGMADGAKVGVVFEGAVAGEADFGGAL